MRERDASRGENPARTATWLVASVAAFGLLIALGTWIYNRDPRKAIIVVLTSGAFLLLWAWVFRQVRRRQLRVTAEETEGEATGALRDARLGGGSPDRAREMTLDGIGLLGGLGAWAAGLIGLFATPDSREGAVALLLSVVGLTLGSFVLAIVRLSGPRSSRPNTLPLATLALVLLLVLFGGGWLVVASLPGFR